MEDSNKKLNYKASNIALAEKKLGLRFFSVIKGFKTGEVGFIDILFLWSAGGGDKDEFDKRVIDDTENIMVEIMQGLSDAGFLGAKGKFSIEQARKELRKALKD
ncbi:hypothetical protein IKD67_01770 [Candidatus Saccharibacteria bacterium]|nr:hypothetical protein [Candidatus Saccharibacteria bacterium]